MSENWIRLKHGREEKGSDTKFTLLTRKDVDNENEDKIKIRRINNISRGERHGTCFGREEQKQRRKITITNLISCLYYFYCSIRREWVQERLSQCQGHYLCSWTIWTFWTPLDYHEGMCVFAFSILLVLFHLSKANKDLMDTGGKIQHQPH